MPKDLDKMNDIQLKQHLNGLLGFFGLAIPDHVSIHDAFKKVPSVEEGDQANGTS